MTEYEFSTRVSSVDEIIKFVKSQKPLSSSNSSMRRMVYINKEEALIGRITIIDGQATLDFKEHIENSKSVKTAKETKPLPFNKMNEKTACELLEMLEFKHKTTLEKTRVSYIFKDYKIDIDSYTQPEKAFVFEIESTKMSVVEFIKTKYSELINKYAI